MTIPLLALAALVLFYAAYAVVVDRLCQGDEDKLS